jgi:hypothetical protein
MKRWLQRRRGAAAWAGAGERWQTGRSPLQRLKLLEALPGRQRRAEQRAMLTQRRQGQARRTLGRHQGPRAVRAAAKTVLLLPASHTRCRCCWRQALLGTSCAGPASLPSSGSRRRHLRPLARQSSRPPPAATAARRRRSSSRRHRGHRRPPPAAAAAAAARPLPTQKSTPILLVPEQHNPAPSPAGRTAACSSRARRCRRAQPARPRPPATARAVHVTPSRMQSIKPPAAASTRAQRNAFKAPGAGWRGLAQPSGRAIGTLQCSAGLVGCKLVGVGSSTPQTVLTNSDLAKYVDTNDEWIVSRTGIRQRHVLAEGETLSQHAAAASRRALEMAGISAGEVDLILMATSSPDDAFGNACAVSAAATRRRPAPAAARRSAAASGRASAQPAQWGGPRPAGRVLIASRGPLLPLAPAGRPATPGPPRQRPRPPSTPRAASRRPPSRPPNAPAMPCRRCKPRSAPPTQQPST